MSAAAAQLEPEVAAWVGRSIDAGWGDLVVERGQIVAWCEATENGNPLYWDEALAHEVTGGWIAPPTALSLWMRPLLFSPAAGPRVRPLEIHFQLKDALGLPEGIVTSNEIVFGEPLRPGDRVRTTQTVREISAVRTNRLGTGRDWVIDVIYSNQRGEVVGTETYRMFGYRRGARA